jgi:hypothetical protein
MRLGLATGRIEAELDLAAGCVVGWKENAPGGLHLAECRLGAPALHETGAYDVNYGKELRAWEDGLNGRKTVLSPSRHEILPLSGGRVAVAFEYESGNSLFRQEFLAAPGADALEVAFTGDWREIERFCKLHFRLGAEDPDAPEQTGFADRAYGFEDALPEGRESPMQYLCGVRDARRGVAILNDGRYGCRRVGGEVELSAIRCATYPARRSDAGPFRLTYRIRPFAVEPGWRLRLLREAFAYNVRPLAFAPETALASGPAAWSPALVEETTGLIHGLRPDVSGRRIALRLYNPGTEPMHARLHPPDPFPLAHGSNAIDDLGEALAPEATLAVHPHGVRTILFCKREDEA